MALRTPEGTRDLLPNEAHYWIKFQQTAFSVFSRYGYIPVDTPIFEQTELFVRGIGEATDVVSKEMFQAISGENMKRLLEGEAIKSKSRLSLRPEGTAGVVRAVVQHDLVPQGAAPVKLMYAGPMFRAERPQKGRQRQFNQIGIECLGADAPSVDAEAIIMLMRFFESIGIVKENMRLLINSMGCDVCRPEYREKLRSFMDKRSSKLCDECLRRAEINPLRAFDCKNPDCVEVMNDAPLLADYLCDDCSRHHGAVKALVAGVGVDYEEDPTLVRGLDYYTRTVFEVQVIEGLGSQNAIGGGGRYDKLAEELGGRNMPGLGFALGYERCLLAVEASGYTLPEVKSCDLYFACVDDSVRFKAFSLLQQCREAGLVAEMDHQGRSLKSQFKVADKLNAPAIVVLGPDELASQKVTIRNMETHDEVSVDIESFSAIMKQLASRPHDETRRVFIEEIFAVSI